MLPALLLQAAVMSYDITGSAVTNPAPLVEREAVTVSFGTESFEQFEAVHVSTPWSHKPMILVAPLGFGATWYEGTDEYVDSMLARLAYLGIDLWIVEQRRGTSATLPSGSCPGDPASPVPAPVDCSAFGQWGVADVIDDIGFVRTLIDSELTPTIGGHWTGGMTALAAVDAEPEEYAGLMLWEGTTYAEDPATLGKNSAVCGILETVPDAFGADPTPASEFLAATLAEVDPDGLSPFPQSVLDPFFLTAGVATNLEVLHAIFIVDNFAGLLDRVAPGLVFMVGTVEDGPTVADIDTVFNIKNMPPNGTYASLGILRDLACGLGGDPTFTSNLDSFEGDVFAIGSDRGLVDELEDTLDQFTAAHTYSDFRGEFGVHDLIWSDLREDIDVEIFLFNLFAQI